MELQARISFLYSFTDWTSAHNIYVDYIEAGCPYQDAYIKRCNRSYRNEALGCYFINNLNEVNWITEDWIQVYNTQRLQGLLNDMTPV